MRHKVPGEDDSGDRQHGVEGGGDEAGAGDHDRIGSKVLSSKKSQKSTLKSTQKST